MNVVIFTACKTSYNVLSQTHVIIVFGNWVDLWEEVVWSLLFRGQGEGWQREILQILNLPSEVGISVSDSLYINFCIRPCIIIHNCKTCSLHFYIFGSNWSLERGHGITVSIYVFHVLSVEKYICTKINSFSLLTVEGWFQKILPPGPYHTKYVFHLSEFPKRLIPLYTLGIIP